MIYLTIAIIFGIKKREETKVVEGNVELNAFHLRNIG